MTRPLTHVTEKILHAMLKERRFSSMRDIAVSAGLIHEPINRNSASLRLAQRAVGRLVKRGLIRQHIDSHKVDNRYELSAAGRTFAATEFSAAASPKRRDDQHAQAPR